jgi:hypothetical protein
VARWLAHTSPQAIRDWAQSLGVETFVGTSGRVFPLDLKAAPLLRAWLHQMRGLGLRLHMRHRWQGWQAGDAPTTLRLHAPSGDTPVQADAVVLLASFATFGPPGREGRRLRAALTGMAASLEDEVRAREMLGNFTAKVAEPQSADLLPPGPLDGPLDEANRARLRQDLDLLAGCHSLPDGFPLGARVLIVEAGSDHPAGPAALAGTVAGLLSASPGAFGGLRSLLATRQFLQMNLSMLVVPEQFGLVHADQAFDASGALQHAPPQAGVARVVSAVLRVAKALKAAD